MDNTNSPQYPEQAQKKESFLSEIVKFTIITLAVVLPIRMFVAQPFIVSGASMDPTFETSEYLIVDQLSYRLGEPERGEVVVFKYPNDKTKYFIKRIIGLPGETVVIDGTSVTIKNKIYQAGFKLDEPYISTKNQKEDEYSTTLKSNEYFVMGDNRRESFDSRTWGVLPRDLMVGTPFVRLYPFNRIGIYPGSFNEAK